MRLDETSRLPLSKLKTDKIYKRNRNRKGRNDGHFTVNRKTHPEDAHEKLRLEDAYEKPRLGDVRRDGASTFLISRRGRLGDALKASKKAPSTLKCYMSVGLATWLFS